MRTTLTVAVDGRIDPEDLHRIADLIDDGYTQGEFRSDEPGGRGWWSIDEDRSP